MKASELIEELRSLIKEHNSDLVVSIIHADHEFSVGSVIFEKQESIARAGNRQSQNPPDRIVIEAEDELEDAD